MTYKRRIAWSALVAALFHVVFLAWLTITMARASDHVPGLMVRDEPLVLHLKPPSPPKRLVDTTHATEEPVDPLTDLISDQNAKASDFSEVQGERPAPYMEKQSKFDEIGGGAVSAVQAKPPVNPTPVESKPVPVSKPKPETPRETHKPDKAAIQAPPEPEEKKSEPFDMARAEPTPPVVAERPVTPEGRAQGGVSSKGFVGFEAYKDELAPYLKDIRRRVEGQWKAALQLRYSGTEPIEAVLDCVISPDGRLISVDIIESGISPTYASLCKMAMERAAPFGPFPFKVPEIYRSQNLEIRWTFSFFK